MYSGLINIFHKCYGVDPRDWEPCFWSRPLADAATAFARYIGGVAVTFLGSAPLQPVMLLQDAGATDPQTNTPYGREVWKEWRSFYQDNLKSTVDAMLETIDDVRSDYGRDLQQQFTAAVSAVTNTVLDM